MTFRMGHIKAARLSPVEVLAIREAYDAGMTQRELCWKYNVSIMTIGRIVRGETWQQYGGPGTHPGATRRPIAQVLHEDAEDRMIDQRLRDTPPPSDAEIAASLARLREMGIEPKEATTADPLGSGTGTADNVATTGEGK